MYFLIIIFFIFFIELFFFYHNQVQSQFDDDYYFNIWFGLARPGRKGWRGLEKEVKNNLGLYSTSKVLMA